MNTPMYSAWMFDREHGWHGLHRISLDNAIRHCKDYRNDWAGSLVALVPYGEDPEPYFTLAFKQ